MSPRTRRLLLTTCLVGCAPEPASSVELELTLAEVVDLGRARILEHAIVGLATDLDPAAQPAALAATTAAAAALASPCAVVTAPGINDVRVDFGAPGSGCTLADLELSGAVLIRFSEPTPAARLLTIRYLELGGVDVTLAGLTTVTWGADDTRRVIGELRLATADARQLEIQSDSIQRTVDGALQLDGWYRWETLLGRWQMELAGWELAGRSLVPGRGLGRVSTPYQNEVVLDFSAAGSGDTVVRANGGRQDRVFTVAEDGAIADLGDD